MTSENRKGRDPERGFRVITGQCSRMEHDALIEAGCPPFVPWSLLAPHEAQALRNHDQTLEKLNERGGLGVGEMVAVIEGLRLSEIRDKTELEMVPRLLEHLRKHEGK